MLDSRQLFSTADTHRAAADHSAEQRRGIAFEQPVQCAIRARGQFENGVTPNLNQQNDLQAIAGAIDVYNAIIPGQDQDFQLRLGAIKNLQEHIYAWFDHHKTRDISQVANIALLNSLHTEVEAEHESIIHQISLDPQLLPINTNGLLQPEILRVQTLWTSLLNDTGNIRVKNDIPAFRLHMLASLAKLLEGQFGRDMLVDLNTDRGNPELRIIVGNNFTQELGNKEKNVSEAVPISSVIPGREKESDLVGASDHDNQVHPEYLPINNQFSPQDFHDFIIANGDEQYIKWGGEALKKGTGVGSYVRVVSEPGYLVGEDEGQILMPDFITLGHELGHAQRILRGAPLQGLELTRMGVQQGVDEKFWNNAEEHVNIKGVENRLRDEHHISRRKYHAGDQWTLRFERNLQALSQRRSNWMGNQTQLTLILLYFHPLAVKVGNYFSEKPDFGDQNVVDLANQELDEVIDDARSQEKLWQIAGQYIKHDQSDYNKMVSYFQTLLPLANTHYIAHGTKELIYAFVDHCFKRNDWTRVGLIINWMNNKNYTPIKRCIDRGKLAPFLTWGISDVYYRKFDPNLQSLPVLLAESRVANDWRVVHQLIKKGEAKKIFETGLTPTEFEQNVDPHFDLDVEIDYTTFDPKAWLFKYSSHVYVRKKMRR